MNIILRPLNIEILIEILFFKNPKEQNPTVIQYVDFNVLNLIYEKKNNLLDLSGIYLYPDSLALFFYIKFFIDKKFKKIVSTDLQYELLQELNKLKASIFLFGDSDMILDKATKNIKNKYSKIKVAGIDNGYNFNTDNVISNINKCNIDVLFVGLGLGRQEKWIFENYKKINAKVILSVGGWFQYLAENKRRAPKYIRRFHLEWFHKILVEFPRVWKRYLIGFPLFLYRVFTKKIQIVVEK